MIRIASCAAAALVMGCMQTPAANETAPTPAPEDATGNVVTCDAAKVQDVIGKRASAVGEDARIRAGAGTLRTIAPGQAVTMDYRTDRLNLETDAAGIVTKVRCG